MYQTYPKSKKKSSLNLILKFEPDSPLSLSLSLILILKHKLQMGFTQFKIIFHNIRLDGASSNLTIFQGHP